MRVINEPSQLVQVQGTETETERTEPDLAVYADALLLADALKRYDVTDLSGQETSTLVTSIRCCSTSSAMLVTLTELSPREVYEIEDREYAWKADVDEEHKETRLQGLKDQLAVSDQPEAGELREEIDDLEARFEELTEFSSI